MMRVFKIQPNFNVLMALIMMSVVPYAQAKSVEEVVKEALESNPEMIAAFYAVSSKRYQKKASYNNYLPKITLSGDAGREYTDNDLRDSKEENRSQARLEIRQPLYAGGGSSSEVSRADANLQAEIFRAQAQAEDFSLQVIDAYLKVVKSKELVVLAQENIDIHDRTKKKVVLRHMEGVGDKADVAQINGRISRAKANLNNARNELMDARSAYTALVGSLPIITFRPKPDLSYVPESKRVAQNIALSQNPKLKQSMYEVDAAESSLKNSKSNYYPNIDFVIDGGMKKNVAGFDGKEEDARAVVELNWVLYSGGRTSNSKQASHYRFEEVKMLSNNTRREILQRIDMVWAGYNRSKNNINYLHDYVVFAKQSEDLYYDQFQVDRRSLLDLLDSANELFEARKSYLEAEFRLINDTYKIIHALGLLTESLRIDFQASIENQLAEE